MLDFIIPLLASFFNSSIFTYCLLPVLCLAFIACVPCIFRYIFRRD